jgi:hypothetical protein
MYTQASLDPTLVQQRLRMVALRISAVHTRGIVGTEGVRVHV